MEPHSCKNQSKMTKFHQTGTQMAPTWPPNVPPEASKWTRRPQDGSRGAKMASRRVQEVSKDYQDGSKDPQHDPKRAQDGPKRGQDGSKMAPRGFQRSQNGCQNCTYYVSQNIDFSLVFPMKITYQRFKMTLFLHSCVVNDMT